MRVLFLTSSFPRMKGDYQGNFILKLAENLTSSGIDVTVLAPHSYRQPFQEITGTVRIRRFPYFYPYRYEVLPSEGGVFFSIRGSVLGKIELPFFVLSQFVHALKIVRTEKIDIVHSHWVVPSGLVGALVRVYSGRPHILSTYLLDVEIFRQYPRLRPLMRFITGHSDSVIAISRFTRDGVLGIAPGASKKMSVIPMGTDPISDTDSIEKAWIGEPTVLFVGRLIPWKGIDVLIHAMRPVVDEYPRARLVVIGEGPEMSRLKELVEELNLAENIDFAGKVTDEVLRHSYQTADIFVLPSVTREGIVMEGLGVVLLEAMAHGVPVIGSNIGGIPDIIEDGVNGFLVPEGAPDLLAEKIKLLASDVLLREHLGDNAVLTVRTRFAWHGIAQDVADIYRDLTHGR